MDLRMDHRRLEIELEWTYRKLWTVRRHFVMEEHALIVTPDILYAIDQDWEFMKEEDCVPVKLALELMDSSSLGRAHQYGDFRELHTKLQLALQSIVNG